MTLNKVFVNQKTVNEKEQEEGRVEEIKEGKREKELLFEVNTKAASGV